MDDTNELIENLQLIHPPYSMEEVEAILKIAKAWRWRHQALWIAFHTGLRPSEIQNLDVQHINLEEGLIHVYSGKEDRYREVFVDDIELLETWANFRKTLGVKGDSWLFELDGKRPCLKSKGVLKGLSKKVGIEVDWNRCRSTFRNQKLRI